MSWFSERTMEWVTDECARVGVSTKASEAEMDEPSAPARGINTPSDTRTARARAPIGTPDVAAHNGHNIPRMCYRWMHGAGMHAMGATDSMYSPLIAATHAGASMRKVAGPNIPRGPSAVDRRHS
jgi:hypothetical protein